MSIANQIQCLRREYLEKLEDAPLSENKGAFHFYGHRLSSLYRIASLPMAWLINRYPASSFSKYSDSGLSTGVGA